MSNPSSSPSTAPPPAARAPWPRSWRQHFGFAHLDSGALYRLTALAVLEAKGDPTQRGRCPASGAQTIDFNRAGDPAIRTDIVGKAASQVAAIPAVRSALLDFQQNFLAHPARRQPRRGDGRARHRHRHLPHRHRQALCRCPAGNPGPPPLGGTQGHGHPPGRAGSWWPNWGPGTRPTKAARFRP